MKKKMKPSKAMLRGFAMAGGNQCTGEYFFGDPKHPVSVCAIGALQLGRYADADCCIGSGDVDDVFITATGTSIVTANDAGMSIPDIAGILASEGY